MDYNLLNKYKDLILAELESNPTNNPKENIDIENMFKLDISEKQQIAFDLFKEGKNMLLTSGGGCGKSYIIKIMYDYIKENFPYKKIFITSTTGISAYSIGGITINSYMGFGTGEQDINILYRKIKNNKETLKRLLTTNILIIDEVSMLSAEIFEKTDLLLKTIRNNNTLFGGVQVILSGDFLQLQPVFKNRELKNILLESKIFLQNFSSAHNNIIILKENFRQNDGILQQYLNKLRYGILNEDFEKIINNKIKKANDNDNNNLERYIHLVPSNSQADEINKYYLNKLTTKQHTFDSAIHRSNVNKDVEDILEKELLTQLKSIVKLDLKINCKVMLLKNLNVEKGLVNGATGVVLSINPINLTILFDNGLKQDIKKEDFLLEMNDIFQKTCVVGLIQFPVKLAWGLTIHKSQSLTLDYVCLDLEKCFCEHQIYVALSRVKNIDNLIIKTFNRNKIKVSQKCLNFYNTHKDL
jgi:ATP-dependent exoDNAse (exonuclease V) alpha subunit